MSLQDNATRIEVMRRQSQERQAAQAVAVYEETRRKLETGGAEPDAAHRRAIAAVFRFGYRLGAGVGRW